MSLNRNSKYRISIKGKLIKAVMFFLACRSVCAWRSSRTCWANGLRCFQYSFEPRVWEKRKGDKMTIQELKAIDKKIRDIPYPLGANFPILRQFIKSAAKKSGVTSIEVAIQYYK